jgi:hypothetical protein
MTTVTGTVSSTTGTTGWTNPQNIYTSNDVYAVTSANINGNSLTGYIYALGNGFSVPSTATIDGVELVIEAKNALSGNGFTLRFTSSECMMVHAAADIGVPATGNQTWTSTADQTKTFGSPTALWNTSSLTPAIVNDSTFGFRCRFFNLNGLPQTFSIDRISVIVYYTEGGVQSSQQFFSRRF